MAEYYFYDGDKDMGFHGYTSEKDVIRSAMSYATEHPRRYIGVYINQRFGGYFLGRVYIGSDKGRKVAKFKTENGNYILNRDGTIRK